MDDHRFDDLARSLINPSSRRGALLLLAGALAALPLLRPDGAAACAPPGGKCNPNKPGRCCSGKCSPKGTCLCTKASQCRTPLPCKKAVCARGKCTTQNKSDGAACDGGACCGGTCIAVESSCAVPGKLGICASGALRCVNGQAVCEQTQQPQTETCNGLDDDCDGVTDNGQGLCPPEKVCRDGNCVCAGGSLCNRTDCFCPQRGYYCHTRVGESHGDCRCDPFVFCGNDCPCPASGGYVCSASTQGTCRCDGTRCGTACDCPAGKTCSNGLCVCDGTRCDNGCGCSGVKVCDNGQCVCDGFNCGDGCGCDDGMICRGGRYLLP